MTVPSGISTAATTRSKTRALGSSSTRMTDPAMTPGTVPPMRTRASRPPVWCCRQYRYRPPREFARFKQLTPVIAYHLEGHSQRFTRPNFAPTSTDFEFCRQFIVTAALRVAQEP
jgi:hypothetical protein